MKLTFDFAPIPYDYYHSILTYYMKPIKTKRLFITASELEVLVKEKMQQMQPALVGQEFMIKFSAVNKYPYMEVFVDYNE